MKRAMPLVATLFLWTQALFAMDLPTAPPGYAWQEIPEIKAAFLKPTGWHFKRESKKGTLAYFITKEDIDKVGRFDTGLTINVIREMKGRSAVEYAKSFVDRLTRDKRGEQWTRTSAPLVQFGCRYKASDARGTAKILTLMVANQKTNTLYLFIFESPESDLDSASQTGEKIMDMLAIDDEV